MGLHHFTRNKDMLPFQHWKWRFKCEAEAQKWKRGLKNVLSSIWIMVSGRENVLTTAWRIVFVNIWALIGQYRVGACVTKVLSVWPQLEKKLSIYDQQREPKTNSMLPSPVMKLPRNRFLSQIIGVNVLQALNLRNTVFTGKVLSSNIKLWSEMWLQVA